MRVGASEGIFCFLQRVAVLVWSGNIESRNAQSCAEGSYFSSHNAMTSWYDVGRRGRTGFGNPYHISRLLVAYTRAHMYTLLSILA